MAISDPRDLPDLAVWYSAEAETGYTNGQEINQWTDLSGNGLHAVKNGADWRPAWQATSGPAGGPSLWFNGGQSLALPSAVLSGAAAGEIFVQFRPDSRGSNSHWALGADTGTNDENHFPYSGTVYEGFGRPTDSRLTFSSTGLLATWFRYNLWSAPDDWAARANEVVKASAATNTPTWTSNLTIGRGRKSSAASGYLFGNMAAVLVFRRKLTPAERADVTAWMQANPSGGVPAAAPPPVPASPGPYWSDGTDFHKLMLRRAVATADRPTNLTADDVGDPWFDRDLVQPIWWGGTGWVDALGDPI